MSQPIAFAFNVKHNLPDALRLALLGGKGKSLSDMTGGIGLPVPPGFTLTTSACREYLKSGWSPAFDEAVELELSRVEGALGRSFGDPTNPLLLSVRSGGAASMPGMMDTVLNVGLNKNIVAGLARQNSGDHVFAKNCLERLYDSFRKSVGTDPPEDPRAQLRCAIEAVFMSWNSKRAGTYRMIENIANDAGTAVNIQAMVFGNRDDQSGTGVVFSRDPSTGEKRIFGDILFRAQGEDVVAGTHQTMNIERLAERLPDVAVELDGYMEAIERHYRDLVDVEFTIESGRLWILQARPGKRAPAAAVRIARDMAEDPSFPLTRSEARARVDSVLCRATVCKQSANNLPLLGKGIGASPGITSGMLVTDTQSAVRIASQGHLVILARPETSPEDIEGISAASGLVTSRGGLASHAAVVARGWGKPAVVGWTAMTICSDGIKVDGRLLRHGETISIDGQSGQVFVGALEGATELIPEAREMQEWAIGSAPDSVESAPLKSALTDDEFVILIGLKGFCTRDAAIEISGLEAQSLEERLRALDTQIDASSPRFLKVTEAGKERLLDLIMAHRRTLGDQLALQTLRNFHVINGQFKTLVTDWQMRSINGEAVFNDHSDAGYDDMVLERMNALHLQTLLWIESVVEQGSISFFRARFEAALHRLTAGETAYLASPKVDSYHNVWFELHEYLIRLAGTTRAAVEAH